MTASSERLRVLLVDDEPPARARVRRLLAEDETIEVIGEVGDGEAALEAIDTLKPDVVLLDVQMPELDGLGVAAALGAQAPAIIFATAHDEHALKAFELAAVDYLLKPIAKDRLRAALDRVRARSKSTSGKQAASLPSRISSSSSSSSRSSKMAVRSGTKYVVFDLSRVTAILAQDHYAAISLADGKELLSDESLDTLMTRLDPDKFLRVHRSAIVNIESVKELDQEGDRKYVAILEGNPARIPISRDRLDEVKSRLGI
jgi:two-component system, LytTR family, response regulator